MGIKFETMVGLFGGKYIITKHGPEFWGSVAGVVMRFTKEVMEEACEDFPDEGAVFIYPNIQEGQEGTRTRAIAVAEQSFFEGGECVFVSRVTKSGYLSKRQLLIIKKEGAPAEAFSLSIGDFVNNIKFKPWQNINDYDNQLALHDSVSVLTQIAIAKESDKRIKPLDPTELLENFPFPLTIQKNSNVVHGRKQDSRWPYMGF